MIFPGTENIKKNIYLKCKEALIGNQINLRTCAVCAVQKEDDEYFTEKSFESCRRRPAPDPLLSSRLIYSYDVSAFIPELNKVLLPKRGVKMAEIVEYKAHALCL